MASSCVWENVILTITPTFDGVCGMLFFIIILVETIFAKYWHVCQCVMFWNMLGQLFMMLVVTDAVVTSSHKLCVPGAVLPTNGRGSNRKSTQPHNGHHLYGKFWKWGPGNSTTSPRSVEKICRWHFCHSRSTAQRLVFLSHKLIGWQHKVYSRNHQCWWVYTLFRLFGDTSKWWKPANKSL